jgi:hypothetical protein
MRSKLILCCVLGALACAGLGAFAAVGLGGSSAPSPLNSRSDIVRASVRPADSAGRSTARAGDQAKITHLITSNPINVGANNEQIAQLKCSRTQGIPIGGGAISPPAPAQVSISVLSRSNPNTGGVPPRSYFVGVRNLGSSPAQWFATLVCEKGVRGG